MASIHVLFKQPGGGMALGAYLVDLWCMGLKDAYGRLDMTRAEIEQEVLTKLQTRIELERVDLEVVKRLVAGGIRFAQKNGFRLPHRHDRWTALLGDLGPIEQADLRDFGTEDGKLRYVGTESGLRERLIGCPVEQFLARSDVGFIMEQDGETRGDEDEEADEFSDELDLDEAVQEMAETLVSAVRKWCFANGQVPHPRLAEAASVLLTEMADSMRDGAFEELEDGDEDSEADSGETGEMVERVFDYFEPEEQVMVAEALDQVGAFMRQFKTPMEMWEHLDQAEVE